MASASCIDSLEARTLETAPVSGDVLNSAEFSGIYDAHAQPIYYLALRILGNPAQAEDATHDIFLKAFCHLREFRGDAGLRTWLYRIAINHCQNLRKSWHQRNLVNNVEASFWELLSGKVESPLRILESAELGTRIEKTLQSLPDEYRLLLLLVADEELSYEQIGELTTQSSDAVRGKLHRARKAFSAFFSQTA